MHYYLRRRLFTLMAGWGSEATFGSLTNYFFWIPLIMPYFGKSSYSQVTIVLVALQIFGSAFQAGLLVVQFIPS